MGRVMSCAMSRVWASEVQITFQKFTSTHLVQRISPVARRKTTGQMMGTYRGNTNKILTLGVSGIHLNVTVRTLAR